MPTSEARSTTSVQVISTARFPGNFQVCRCVGAIFSDGSRDKAGPISRLRVRRDMGHVGSVAIDGKSKPNPVGCIKCSGVKMNIIKTHIASDINI